MKNLASLKNDLSFLRTKEFPDEKGIQLKAQAVNIFKFALQPETSLLLRLPVPSKLWFIYVNAHLDFDIENRRHQPRDFEPPAYRLPDIVTHNKFTIMVPDVNTIGTDYINEQLPVIYTLKAMRFDSENAGVKSSTTESEKVGVSLTRLDVLKALKGESAGEVNALYEAQWQKAFSFYANQANIYGLEQESRTLNEKYQQLISDVEYSYTENPGLLGTMRKIGDNTAIKFMLNLNSLIADKIETHFKDLSTQMKPFEKLKQ